MLVTVTGRVGTAHLALGPAAPLSDSNLPRFTPWLGPLVDAVARVKAGVHRKLLFGFLTGALLLVAMALLSLLVIREMNDRMTELNRAQVKAGRAQEMLYAVTAQSHYRAMALLLREGADTYNGEVEEAKATFARLLDELEQAEPTNRAFYENVRSVNETYRQSGQKVLALMAQGGTSQATVVHLREEHLTSHRLEASMNKLIATAKEEMVDAQADFRSARTLLTGMVIAFSALSVIVALLLGFVLSWAFILPVRKMESVLADVTSGSFDQRVDVPNRDEFGALAGGLNTTTERLATLFDDQRQLAARLRDTNASLERASEAKSRFLANVSHELRTPMTAILGFTDALLAGVDGPLNSEQEASLRWVQRGGDDLLGLINEILDLAKIESGKLSLDVAAFDPRELVETVVAQHRSLAAQKGLRFTWRDVGAPAEVTLDRQRVRQILVNLVGNALKFTDAGEVEVVAAGTGEALHVTVCDTGPVISSRGMFARRRPGARPGSRYVLSRARRV